VKSAYHLNWISMDINLMPKHVNKSSVMILSVLVILAAMGCSSAFGWYWYDEHNKLSSLKQQLTEAAQLTSGLESKLKENTSGDQLSNVLKQPALLKQQRPLMTHLLTQLNQLLPLFANVTQLELNEQGTLKLTLYFATSEDVISFSKSIQASEYFKLVRMGTINNVTNTIGTNTDHVQPLKGEPSPESANSLKLPVYQTTFELKYMSDGKRG
jgi:Tfp pilus assembly protein PilN